MKDEIAEELATEIAEGMDKAILSTLQNLMDSMKWTTEQAMQAMKVPVDERARCASKL